MRAYGASMLCMFVVVPSLAVAAKTPPEGLVELTERGKQLEAAFAKVEQSMKAEIEMQLPAIDQAKVAAWMAMDALGIKGVLGSDQLDGKLAPYMVIKEATPRGLAEFAEKSPENEKLIQQLLANKDLMIQMLVADGPTSRKYGKDVLNFNLKQGTSVRFQHRFVIHSGHRPGNEEIDNRYSAFGSFTTSV